MPRCSVCGGGAFRPQIVLWDGLCSEWRLSPEERAYMDRQQAMICEVCGNNLRSIVLARALLDAFGSATTFQDWIETETAKRLGVLEINEAGTLGPTLSRLPGRILASYPDVDIHALPYADASFDVVVHSDTLEHVARPIRALAECRRVLRPGGLIVFTVPVIVGRLTQDRAGLPPSYHGLPGTDAADYVVHTEYGADMWTHVIRAGFSAVTIHALDYPDALAMSARA